MERDCLFSWRQEVVSTVSLQFLRNAHLAKAVYTEGSKRGVVVPFKAQILSNFKYHVQYKRIKNANSSNTKNETNGDGAFQSVHIVRNMSFVLFRQKKWAKLLIFTTTNLLGHFDELQQDYCQRLIAEWLTVCTHDVTWIPFANLLIAVAGFICAAPCLLQSALDDLWVLLSYPQDIISYTVNDVLKDTETI